METPDNHRLPETMARLRAVIANAPEPSAPGRVSAARGRRFERLQGCPGEKPGFRFVGRLAVRPSAREFSPNFLTSAIQRLPRWQGDCCENENHDDGNPGP